MPERPVPYLRRREARDVDECAPILKAVHASDGYPVNWPDDPCEWLSPPSMLAAWVAELDGRVVGHAILSSSIARDVAPALWSSREGADVASTSMLHRLFVDPAARGHGIGALLIAQVVRDADQRGLHALLEVVDTDSPAAALYERLGWLLIGTVEQQWHAGQTVVVRCYAAPTPAAL